MTWFKNVNEKEYEIILDKELINVKIYPDDTVYTMKAKIAKMVYEDKAEENIDKIYIWCKHSINIKNKELVITTFLQNLFTNRVFVSKAEFLAAIKNVFSINDNISEELNSHKENVLSYTLALTILRNNDIKKMYEVVGHKYMVGNAYIYDIPIIPSKTENIVNNISNLNNYNIISEDHRLVYSYKCDKFYVKLSPPNLCPNIQHDQSFDRVINNSKIVDDIVNYKTILKDKVKISSHPTFIHVKYPSLNENQTIDLFELFSRSDISNDVCFIKCVQEAAVYYKLNKELYINNKITKDHINKWTKTNKNNNLLILKCIVKSRVHSILIYSSGMIDVKYIINKDNSYSYNDYISDEKQITHILTQFFKNADVGYNFHDTDNKNIIKSNIVGNITLLPNIKPPKHTLTTFKSTISQLTPFLNIIGENSSDKAKITRFLYKRVENYYTNANINNFINRNEINNTNDKANNNERINNLEILFDLKREVAKDTYNTWKSINKGKKILYNIQPFNGIMIKIELSRNGLSFNIDGIQNYVQEINILSCLTKSFIEPSKSKIAIHYINIGSDNESDNESDNDENDNDNDNDENVPNYDFNFDKNEYSSETIQNLEYLKTNKICPPIKSNQKGGKDFLTALKQANATLFTSEQDEQSKKGKHSKQSGYSTKCQWSDRKQPVVMTNDEIEYNNKCFKHLESNYLEMNKNYTKYGSTPQLRDKNNYVCPEIWCPRSRVALSMDIFEKYGKKCPFPDVDEEPEYLVKIDEEKPNKSTNKYIGFLESSHQGSRFCAPCCAKQLKIERINKCLNIETNAKEDKNNRKKYIMSEKFPTVEGRYSLLPSNLAKLFSNKNTFHGGKDGLTGAIGEKTNCYVKYGLTNSKQPFLEAISKSQESFIKIDYIKYILLNNGTTANQFVDLSRTKGDKYSITNFQNWFLSDEAALYIQLFNLEYLKSSVKLYAKDKDFVEQDAIEREALLYHSYELFKNYCNDNSIYKTHDIFLDYFDIDKTVIIFELIESEENDVDNENGEFVYLCNNQYDYEKSKQLLFLVKYKNYYEPIHKIEYKNKKFEYTSLHDRNSPDLKKVIDFIVKTCYETKKYKSDNKDIEYIVLNYDRSIYGIYTKKGILIPYDDTVNPNLKYYMENNYKFIYIDRLLEIHDKPISKKNVESIIKNKSYAIKLERDNYILTTHGYVIPLNKLVNKENLIKDDIAIYLNKQDNDSRLNYMSQIVKVDLLYKSFWNHVLSVLNKDEVSFLRHRNNPMSKDMKRSYLQKLIKEKFDIFQFDSNDNINYNISHDNVCYENKTADDCKLKEPCTWIFDLKKKSGSCKLKIPEYYKENYVNKIIDELLNPYVKLQKKYINRKQISDKTLYFTNQDTNIDKILDNLKHPEKQINKIEKISYKI